MTENSSKLLIDEFPLQVLPSLAKLIGLNEAIILQQIHYWLARNGQEHEGKKWIYNSYSDWQEQFPFWSVRTIQRTIRRLEKLKVLVSDNFNEMKIDRTKWYTIDYSMLNKMVHHNNKESSPKRQDVAIKKARCRHQEGKMSPPIPETTTETTTENITPPNPPKGGHKRVSSSEPKNKRLNPLDYKPEWMPLEDWKDILEIRKKAKAINTERSLKIYVSELEKAHSLGYSSEQITNTICSHAWRGFKAQWMVNEFRDQRSEFRDQRSEVRSQKSEIRDQKSENRGLPDISEEELAAMRKVGLKKLKELREHLSHIASPSPPIIPPEERLPEAPLLDLSDYEVSKFQAVKAASLAALEKIIAEEKGDVL